MGINVFLGSLLAIAVGAYFIPVENLTKSDDNKDIPLVVFDNPQMYTLSEDSLSRVVEASHAIRYKTRDEMLNASITIKNRDSKKEYDSEKLKAKTLIKRGEVFSLTEDVHYQRDDIIDLTTEELNYNLETKIAYNNSPYKGKYYKHDIKGEKLYLDVNKNNMKSDNVHFEIDMKNKR